MRGLTSLDLSRAEEIEVQAVHDCPDLKTIVLGDGLAKMSLYSFEGSAVEDVYYPYTMEEFKKILDFNPLCRIR